MCTACRNPPGHGLVIFAMSFTQGLSVFWNKLALCCINDAITAPGRHRTWHEWPSCTPPPPPPPRVSKEACREVWLRMQMSPFKQAGLAAKQVDTLPIDMGDSGKKGYAHRHSCLRHGCALDHGLDQVGLVGEAVNAFRSFNMETILHNILKRTKCVHQTHSRSHSVNHVHAESCIVFVISISEHHNWPIY